MKKLLSAKELQNKLMQFSSSYFLIDMWNDKDSYYALTPEDLKENIACISGIFVNKILEGKLAEAWQLIDNMPQKSILKLGCILVHPEVTWKQFIDVIKTLQITNQPIDCVTLTAGRPFLLNGFNDFSRIGPFLESHKDKFIECCSYLYGAECTTFIHKLCLAEYYYQKNKLVESEVLVSQTIKDLDKRSEHRLLFVALYLQSRILLVQAISVKSKNYINSIRNYIKETGQAEFSYNLDAAEILGALYENKYNLVYDWLENTAPNEFVDFNMLDLYRYMVKMRCYIVTEKYTAVIALVEKLRPLLEAGKRFMDLCEIDVLLAIALHRANKEELAFEALERALKLAKRYSYYRLIADEGDAILQVLLAYVNTYDATSFLMELIKLSRNMAVQYPLYLKAQYKNNQIFTPTEIEILKLLEQGKTKQEIGEYYFISINTVKYHLKNLYAKLEAHSPLQAIWNAKLLRLI
ncbi:MAG: LuxR C-terminal-related transcriptional regulator [Treponema sp.]|nr:LuxR C-terminal-related transcriptional regulator [Treponema sp.]